MTQELLANLLSNAVLVGAVGYFLTKTINRFETGLERKADKETVDRILRNLETNFLKDDMRDIELALQGKQMSELLVRIESFTKAQMQMGELFSKVIDSLSRVGTIEKELVVHGSSIETINKEFFQIKQTCMIRHKTIQE